MITLSPKVQPFQDTNWKLSVCRGPSSLADLDATICVPEPSKNSTWSSGPLTIAFYPTSYPLSSMGFLIVKGGDTEEYWTNVIGLLLSPGPWCPESWLPWSLFSEFVFYAIGGGHGGAGHLFLLMVIFSGCFQWEHLSATSFFSVTRTKNLKYSYACSKVRYAAKTPAHGAPRRRCFLGKNPPILFALLRHLPNNHYP